MDETKWLASDDPVEMLSLLEPWVADGDVSDRQLRLFVCACSRQQWHLLTDETRLYVEAAERLADGEAPHEEIGPVDWGRGLSDGLALARLCLWQDAAYGSPYYYWLQIQKVLAEQHRGNQGPARAGLLRDIFGMPFRDRSAANATWLTGTVLALARGMYESRDFSTMPILADALQDAGCEDEPLLGHCRGPGPHVRGCWALDLCLELN